MDDANVETAMAAGNGLKSPATVSDGMKCLQERRNAFQRQIPWGRDFSVNGCSALSTRAGNQAFGHRRHRHQLALGRRFGT